MNIKITSVGLVLGDEVKEYASKKISGVAKFLERPEDVLCEIELAKTTEHHKSGDIYKAEANVSYMGKQYYVVATADDLYKAIDILKDDLERAIVSAKEKNMTTFRRGASRIKEIIKKLYQ